MTHHHRSQAHRRQPRHCSGRRGSSHALCLVVAGALAIVWETGDVYAQCDPTVFPDINGDNPRSVENLSTDGDCTPDTSSLLECQLATRDIDPSFGHFIIYYNDVDTSTTCASGAECVDDPLCPTYPCTEIIPQSGSSYCHFREQISTEAVENLGYYLECAYQFFYGEMSDGMPFANNPPDDMPVWITKAWGSGGARAGPRLEFPVNDRIFHHVRYNTLHELGHHVLWRYSRNYLLVSGYIPLINEGLATIFEEPLRTIDDGYRSPPPPSYDRFIDLHESGLHRFGYEDATPFWGFVVSLTHPGPREYYDPVTELTDACSIYLDDIIREGEPWAPPTGQMAKLQGRETIRDLLTALHMCIPVNPVQNPEYEEVICAAEDPLRRGIVPDESLYSLHAVREVLMLEISETLDGVVETLGGPIAAHASDPVGSHAVFRMYLEENYEHDPQESVDEDEDQFFIKSFGAHYHEIDISNGEVEVYFESQDDLPIWAYGVFYLDDSVPGDSELVPVDGAGPSGWHLGTSAGTFVIPSSGSYSTAVVIVTALGWTYRPEDHDEVCGYVGHDICGNVCEAGDVTAGTVFGCYAESGGHYELHPDTDGDGVFDDEDNCVMAPNPDQANCDWDDDDREIVDYGLRGDACDPDLCVDMVSQPLGSHVLASVFEDHAFFVTGATSTYHFSTVGAEPFDESVIDNRVYHPLSTQWQADVRMSHCQCEPDEYEAGECSSVFLCQEYGEYDTDWNDSSWTLVDHDRGETMGSGGGPWAGDLMADVSFTRPGHHDNDNEYAVTWRWNDDYPGEDTVDARVWLRPDPNLLKASWPSWPDARGNTYSDVSTHGFEYEATMWLPADLIHGRLQEEIAMVNPPRAADLISDDVEMMPNCSPWCELRHEPFELPSLITAGIDFQSPLLGSRYALTKTSRASLSAIMMRHQRTSTGFVSEYVPLEFDGPTQLDVEGFSSTVMVQAPPDPGSAQDFNDALSIWAFGGQGRDGQYTNELWRGVLDRSGDEPVYAFETITTKTAPSPRRDAILLSLNMKYALVLIGGTGVKPCDDVWMFQHDTHPWWAPQKVALPSGMGLSNAAWYTVGLQTYLFGGTRKDGTLSGELWRLTFDSFDFDRLDGEWTGDRPSPRWGASVVVMDGVLYLFGGRDSQQLWHNDLWAFHMLDGSWELIAGDCTAGENCPPPGQGSALLQSGTPGALTLALGTPDVTWTGTDHEWRYVLWQDLWVTENEERGTWEQ